MKIRYILPIITILLAIATASAQKTITVDGKTRNYLEYIPANLGTNRPLLISCHGMNQDAAYQKSMLRIENVADTAKFVTVFPNGINKAWDISGDQDINFVKALIDRMVSDYGIDRNRVYLSGFSMGGMFTYHAMTKIADKIAIPTCMIFCQTVNLLIRLQFSTTMIINLDICLLHATR